MIGFQTEIIAEHLPAPTRQAKLHGVLRPHIVIWTRTGDSSASARSLPQRREKAAKVCSEFAPESEPQQSMGYKCTGHNATIDQPLTGVVLLDCVY